MREDAEAQKSAPAAEFMVTRTLTLPNQQGMQLNFNVYQGESDVEAMKRIVRGERFFRKTLMFHQIEALEANIKATQMALEKEIEVLEDLHKKQRGVDSKKLKPNELSALANFPIQIEQKRQGLILMEERLKQCREETSEFV